MKLKTNKYSKPKPRPIPRKQLLKNIELLKKRIGVYEANAVKLNEDSHELSKQLTIAERKIKLLKGAVLNMEMMEEHFKKIFDVLRSIDNFNIAEI